MTYSTHDGSHGMLPDLATVDQDALKALEWTDSDSRQDAIVAAGWFSQLTDFRLAFAMVP
jgi:hypothetical protein